MKFTCFTCFIKYAKNDFIRHVINNIFGCGEKDNKH